MHVACGGEVVKLYPWLCVLVGDVPEVAALTLTTGSKKSAYPDPYRLVPKKKLADVDATDAADCRSETWSQQVQQQPAGMHLSLLVTGRGGTGKSL